MSASRIIRPSALRTAGLDRRTLLLGGAAGGLAACAGGVGFGGRGDPTLVSTRQGMLRGVEMDDGVLEFRGVRYAAPPTGAGRFQGPRPPESWSGERPALLDGEAAVQMRAGAGAAAYPPLVQAAMSEAFAAPENVSSDGDEDCLYLNVYTRQTGLSSGPLRPVMVWLHGGGFSYGQGTLNIYRGHNLARDHDVVSVGVNHRLNVFGYLGLDSAGVPGFEGSANAGMLDIVAALEWVQANIAQFGGDPNNVTVHGQSGGGAKVTTLLAMPATQGLIHRAIVQSGAGLTSGTKEQAAETANAYLAELGLSHANAAAEIPGLPRERLLEAAWEVGLRGFRPSIDDVHVTRHPFTPDAPAQAANIPVMVGFTKDEQTLYNVGNPEWFETTEADVLAAAERSYPGRGQAIVDAFKAQFPDYAPHHLLMQVNGTISSLRSSHTLAARKSAQPAGVYAYVFAYDLPPQDFVLKAPHTAEIPYVMDNVENAPLFAGDTAQDRAMGDLMSSVWVQFARTGDPNVEGLPEWPRFNPDTRPTMFFSADSEVVENPYDEVWRLTQTGAA
ncbi:MAG: carboxylesterase family protein [Maricaulaceae bacterium]|jgi:para-nitrobenzyl esterase